MIAARLRIEARQLTQQVGQIDRFAGVGADFEAALRQGGAGVAGGPGIDLDPGQGFRPGFVGTGCCWQTGGQQPNQAES